MPMAIRDVVDALAELRQSTPQQLEQLVHENFGRLIKNDPWLKDSRGALSC